MAREPSWIRLCLCAADPIAPAPKYTRARTEETHLDLNRSPVTFPSYSTSHSFMTLLPGLTVHACTAPAARQRAAGPCKRNNAASQQIEGRARIGGTPRAQEGRRNVAIPRPAAIQRSERPSLPRPAARLAGARLHLAQSSVRAPRCVASVGARMRARTHGRI